LKSSFASSIFFSKYRHEPNYKKNPSKNQPVNNAKEKDNSQKIDKGINKTVQRMLGIKPSIEPNELNLKIEESFEE